MGNFPQLEQFIASNRKAALEYNNFLEGFLLDIAIDVLGRTKEKTPVGETGFLKKSWHLGSVTRTDNELNIELINSMEYASYVENGHFTRNRKSWVDGRFMATLSIEEVESVIGSRYKVAFQNFLNQRGCV